MAACVAPLSIAHVCRGGNADRVRVHGRIGTLGRILIQLVHDGTERRARGWVTRPAPLHNAEVVGRNRGWSRTLWTSNKAWARPTQGTVLEQVIIHSLAQAQYVLGCRYGMGDQFTKTCRRIVSNF